MPLLSILVPIYNEERTLGKLSEELHRAEPQAQIIYIDDGSSDASLRVLKERSRPQDLILTQEHQGKGAAVRLGLLKAQGQYTVIQDADLEYNPNEIQTLLDVASVSPGHAVFGSRFLQENPNLYKRFLIGNKLLTALINTLFRGTITDSYTCYKLLPTDLFRSLKLQAQGFELEAEICVKCLKRRIPIKEIPISYQPRSIAEGKKISWKDAWRGLMTIIHIRLRA